MATAPTDARFSGSIAEIYESLMVPLIFEPYAADLGARAAALQPREVLEIAAGTGAATRALARSLPAGARLVATDLNQPMLDRAARTGTARPVEWRQADALSLPFPDGRFDLVVCQFGVMFFPDCRRAMAEARRVLRSGGTLLLSVWDRIEENEFADVVTAELARLHPADPPRFLARTPHGHHDLRRLTGDLSAAGFTGAPAVQTLPARSRAATARVPALAYCQGTPLRNEIEARGDLLAATLACADAIARRFGEGPVDGKIQAHVIHARA